MATNQLPLDQVKALTFDVFGTVVDWRSSVESALAEALQNKTKSPDDHQLPEELQARARALAEKDIAQFAQQWRNSYSAFTRGFEPGTTPWKDIDTHHYDSLVELLGKWQLAELFTEEEVRALSLVWHRLTPWADSAAGLRRLGTKFVTATLSNGNQSLLRDLNEFGHLGFAQIISAEDFRAYKPSPAVYLGAADKMGVQPTEIAMVAAHLSDLQAARKLGLRTIYVERQGEEAWAQDDARYLAARDWVDIWIGKDEDGFREAADRLGL